MVHCMLDTFINIVAYICTVEMMLFVNSIFCFIILTDSKTKPFYSIIVKNLTEIASKCI